MAQAQVANKDYVSAATLLTGLLTNIPQVDEPRKAVEQADALVAEVFKRLTEGFAQERAELEKQWDRGDQATTEDLRVALRRYKAFFERLLTI